MGHVENAVQRGVARTMVKYEDKMVLLSSLVSGGPFLGLLGTVWGVMVTFGALTEKASIAQLRPASAARSSRPRSACWSPSPPPSVTTTCSPR
jgi:biopolymer transport protein TolQ